MDKLLYNIEPDNTSPEDDIAVFVLLAEHAYTRMYESSHPKDERDEALYQLNMALRIARVLKLKEKEAELSERYAQIEAVFNAQFRG
jgi:hypothetical protein